jgi:hypothetical protein
MARTLNEQASSYTRSSLDSFGGARSPQPPYQTAVPGFAYPNGRGPSPAPPGWNPWSPMNTPLPPQAQAYSSPYPGPSYAPQPPPLRQEDVASSIASLSLGPPPPSQDYRGPPRSESTSTFQPSSYQPGPPPPHPHVRHQSSSFSAPPLPQQASGPSAPPSLTAPLPTVSGLAALLPAIQQPDYDPAQRVAWCKDVLGLVNRAENSQTVSSNPTSVTTADLVVGPVRIGDPQLQRLVDVAVPIIKEISSPNPMPKPTPLHISEAIYLKAMCEASGAYPQLIKRDPRTAFRNFEYAARHGYSAAWFKIGRDYENFGDITHAKDAFERGVKAGNAQCLYVSCFFMHLVSASNHSLSGWAWQT